MRLCGRSGEADIQDNWDRCANGFHAQIVQCRNIARQKIIEIEQAAFADALCKKYVCNIISTLLATLQICLPFNLLLRSWNCSYFFVNQLITAWLGVVHVFPCHALFTDKRESEIKSNKFSLKSPFSRLHSGQSKWQILLNHSYSTSSVSLQRQICTD